MPDVSPPAPPATCARCERTLDAGDRVDTGDRAFCRSCYETLRVELQRSVAEMSQDVPYPRAAVGALLGGAAGALVWWGFTAITGIGFGLIAVAIGFLAGHGAVRFAGGKRSGGLQGLAVAAGVLSFALASYLVNMSLINRALAAQGAPGRVPFPPTSAELAYHVLAIDFGIMDVVFLAIVVYEAWTIPRPIRLAPPG